MFQDEIGAVFDQWQKEAAQKQQYPDVVKSEAGGDAPLADGPTLKVAQQLTPPSCSSPPAKVAPKVPPKRPTLLLPDLLLQQQQDPAATAAKTPTSPLVRYLSNSLSPFFPPLFAPAEGILYIRALPFLDAQ